MSDQLRSIAKTVLRISKRLKFFLEPDAFSDKQFCENIQACDFFAV